MDGTLKPRDHGKNEQDEDGAAKRLHGGKRNISGVLDGRGAMPLNTLPWAKHRSALYQFLIDVCLWLLYFKSFVFIWLGDYAEWRSMPGMKGMTPGLIGG